MIYTTFSLLRQHDACTDGYRNLARHLGGVDSYGRGTPIPLTVVLDSNGADDALWCLRATTEPCDRVARLLAVAFAREVAHLMTDARSLAALDVAERYAHGQASDSEMAAARDAAWAAASDTASWVAASAAARAAAWAAARDAAGDAGAAAGNARDAAWAAAWAAARDAARDAGAAARAAASNAAWAAARTRQAQIMRGMLETSDDAADAA